MFLFDYDAWRSVISGVNCEIVGSSVKKNVFSFVRTSFVQIVACREGLKEEAFLNVILGYLGGVVKVPRFGKKERTKNQPRRRPLKPLSSLL